MVLKSYFSVLVPNRPKLIFYIGALGTPDGLPLVQGKYGPESMILCPSDFKDFELGTLVIGIYSFPSGSIAQGVGAQVTVIVNVFGEFVFRLFISRY